MYDEERHDREFLLDVQRILGYAAMSVVTVSIITVLWFIYEASKYH